VQSRLAKEGPVKWQRGGLSISTDGRERGWVWVLAAIGVRTLGHRQWRHRQNPGTAMPAFTRASHISTALAIAAQRPLQRSRLLSVLGPPSSR
jgi:hypothetical protein